MQQESKIITQELQQKLLAIR